MKRITYEFSLVIQSQFNILKFYSMYVYCHPITFCKSALEKCMAPNEEWGLGPFSYPVTSDCRL